MSGLKAIAEALAAAVSAIPGLTGQTYASGTITPPVAVVLPAAGDAVDYTVVLPGSANVTDANMRIVLLVSTVVDQVATELLYGYLEPGGPQSVRAAVEKDPTLGGVVDFAVCTGAGRVQMTEWADLQYLSAEVYVEIGGSPS